MIDICYKLIQRHWERRDRLFVYRAVKLFLNLFYPVYACLTAPKGVDPHTSIIVSLTTFPARIDKVHIVIHCLLRQKLRPARVHLWLTHRIRCNAEGIPLPYTQWSSEEWCITAPQMNLYVFGENGTVKLGGTSTNNIDVWNFADESDSDAKNKGLQEATSNVYGNGHTSLFADMMDAIEHDRKPYVDAVAGRNALEMVLAIYKSQKTGLPVKLPLTDFASTDMGGEF